MMKILPKTKNLLLMTLILSLEIANGQTISQTFNSSATFTVPLGVTSITAEAWGGGGRGGSRNLSLTSAFGGGGGGAYSRSVIPVIPGTTYLVNVGTGSNSTLPGGDSWFISNLTILAVGGNSTPDDGIVGATGGLASAGIGTIKFNGGNGANGNYPTSGGGGGSSAGIALNGINAINNLGAIAPLGGGNGGNGRSATSGNGFTGFAPGGGGGGAYRTAGTPVGGNGANGKVVLTYSTPEINLQGNNVTIVDGDTTPSLADWTDFNTVATIRTFTIFNTGAANLLIGTIAITGINASDFSIVTLPNSTILPGQNSTLVIRFSPNSVGIKNAIINIANNDNNEALYDFAIQGTGVLPNMNVRGNNTIIADGDITPTIFDWTDFASTNIGSPITRIYTIENVGTMNLNLTGSPIVSIVGTDFTVSTQPTSIVNGISNTTFIVTFNPTSLGIKFANISISNNDAGAGKNPYTFRIIGEGIQAFIDTDGDSIIDNIDNDDDNDGIPDSIEQNYASNSVLGTSIQKILLNETFGSGIPRTRINSNVPTASTTYCYEDGTIAMALDECDVIKDLNDGQYTINHEAGSTNVASWAPAYWYQGPDHTVDTNGRMALFNATNNITFEFYRTIVQGVTANAPLTYSFWILNLDRTDAPGIATRNRPNILVEFRDLSNNLISTISTGTIAPTSVSNPTGDWYNFSATFTPITTGFSIVFRNNQPGGAGNDLALDDILIYQILTDTDQDGAPDVYDLDSDNDGIGGIIEDGWSAFSNGKDRMDLAGGSWADSNGNGWHDTTEAYYVSNLPSNFDNDMVPNYIDLDSDNDTLFDVDEASLTNGDGDINCDAVGEGLDSDSDGILSLFDSLNGYGNTGKPLPNNTLGSGNPDYLKVISKIAGTYDIATTLFNNLDTNSDGVIDGNLDIDRDGIIDTFDTSTSIYGSPRDLNRKLLLDFDGRNDYGQGTGVLNSLSNATLMAWIDLNPTFSSEGIIVGQDRFHLKINSSKKLEAVINGTTLTYNTTSLITSQWYHVAAVYGSGSLKLYLNGNLVTSVNASGAITGDTSLLTIGKNPTSNSLFFKGKIDEVRVFNVALTDSQLQRMVYQEVLNNGGQVSGFIVPKNIGALPFTNLIRYYRMDVYKNDIIDDLTTPLFDIGSGMKIFNNKNIYIQQAPMPFITERNGDFATAVNSPTNEVRGMDIMDQDWSIVHVKHTISETVNNTDLGMLVDSGNTISILNDSKIQNDWYLKLDGKIDLEAKSQLIQTINSDLDPLSSGLLEREQKGTSNNYNYNYWCSPVGTPNTTTNNNAYNVNTVMKDGSTPTPQNINWLTGYNGAPTSPISLSNYWIFKLINSSNNYNNWQYIGQNGLINTTEGFTLKGSGAVTPNQNYTFIGKPNNGTITNVIGANNITLSGNPYPSALDCSDLINANLTSTTGTLYFWEHYNTNNTHVLEDYQGGYAVRNLVGGTPPVAPPGISGLGSSSRVPGRYVPVGQGFFLFGSASGGTITFNNDQRNFIKEDNVDSNFMFRNNALTTPNNSNEDFTIVNDDYKKIRLGFTSKNNYHRQTLIGFMNNNATSNIDAGYDAIHIDNQPSDMYFLNSSEKLNIQGEGFFNRNRVYPIGVKTNEAGIVSFSLDALENFSYNQSVFIYDNQTQIYHKINNNIFSINLPEGVFESRFSLRFKKRNLQNSNNTRTEDEDEEELETDSGVIAYSDKLNIHIQNNEDEKINTVLVFNMIGQLVATFDVKKQDQHTIMLNRNHLSSGTYIIKMKTDTKDITRKIVFY